MFVVSTRLLELSHELLFDAVPFASFFDRSSGFIGADNGLRYFLPVMGDVGIAEYAVNALFVSKSSVEGLVHVLIELVSLLELSACFALRTGILLGLNVRSFCSGSAPESEIGVHDCSAMIWS
jgi:hypothetical protein